MGNEFENLCNSSYTSALSLMYDTITRLDLSTVDCLRQVLSRGWCRLIYTKLPSLCLNFSCLKSKSETFGRDFLLLANKL